MTSWILTVFYFSGAAYQVSVPTQAACIALSKQLLLSDPIWHDANWPTPTSIARQSCAPATAPPPASLPPRCTVDAAALHIPCTTVAPAPSVPVAASPPAPEPLFLLCPPIVGVDCYPATASETRALPWCSVDAAKQRIPCKLPAPTPPPPCNLDLIMTHIKCIQNGEVVGEVGP